MTGITQGIRPNWLTDNLWNGSLYDFGPVYNWGGQKGNNINTLQWNNNYVFNNLYPDTFVGPDVNIFKLGKSEEIHQTQTTTATPQLEQTNKAQTQTQQDKVQSPPAEEKKTVTSTTQTVPKSLPKKNPPAKAKEIGNSLAATAQKYIGYNEADGSSRKFSDSPEWCADFVTYIVNETYNNQGIKVPEGFGNHRTENLKNWGIKNGQFLTIANQKNRAKLISEKVKPGDIMILRENGASHTGFVTEVDKDTGAFKTVEGNRGDKVATAWYSPDYQDLTGFIQLKTG